MASRMEKYYNEPQISRRSKKNAELYRTLYDNTEEYTNIASVAVIDKTNEVDITKIRQMIKDRENYKKQRELNQIIKPNVEVKKQEPVYYEDEKTYDIKDVLSKAKETRKLDEKYESIKKHKYDYLLNSKVYQKKPEKIEETYEEEELKEIINTITSTSKINDLKDSELSLDLLEDLKSENNTMIESSSIRAIIEEEKNRQEKIENESKIEFDKSFYTASLNFNENDFEDEFKEIAEPKKKNTVIKIILTLILITVILVAGYFIINK